VRGRKNTLTRCFSAAGELFVKQSVKQTHSTYRHKCHERIRGNVAKLYKQEAQLLQRNSASAAHVKGRGLNPPVHSPSSGYTYACGRIRKPQRTYVQRAVRKAHFKINRAFKVIQGHPYWCPQESRMVCCRNVQLMPTSFLKLTKIRQWENGKFVDFNDLTQV